MSPAQAQAPASATGAVQLEVRGVSRRFGGLQALDDVSFEVRAGEILALIGPNGAGKSTLLNVIAGALDADQGVVHWQGRSLAGLSADRVNRLGIVRTFQSADVLADLSVCENVMAAGVAGSGSGFIDGMIGAGRARRVRAALRERALRLLALVGLDGLAERSAGLLTAGQQRLLAVARALATEARLLILDEPAAGLNTVEKQQLAQVILRIRGQGTTVVFVEHDLGFVGRLAERMVVLDHGRVIAQGDPARVRSDPAVLEAYLGNTDVSRRPVGAAGDEVPPAAQRPPLLVVQSAVVRYGGLTAVQGLGLEVAEGEIVALIGANGAGKSSLLKAIAGAQPLTSGQVRWRDADLGALRTEARVGLGISLAPEGRALFPALTVRDNLLIGRFAQLRRAGIRHLLRPSGAARRDLAAVLDEVVSFFPRLAERLDQQAGTLSGGEGQMLAIGRALMNRPKLLMLDEPSLGLAPRVAREILESLPKLSAAGVTVLLVEQNARSALQIADRAYVIANGSVVAHDTCAALLGRADIVDAYLGWDQGSEPIGAVHLAAVGT